jgi:hypothetical protein
MRLRFTLALLTGVAAAAPAAAQEVYTFLKQPNWSAAGVTTDAVHFYFCAVKGDGHGGENVWLQVWRPDGPIEVVTVMLGEGHAPTSAAFDIDGIRYPLEQRDNGEFQTPEAGSGAVIDAMQRGHKLVLRLQGTSAEESFDYDLSGFAEARAAVVKSCSRS